MILYKENPKDSNKKLQELIKKFSKVTGYKINLQKSVAFLYTNNKLSEKEVKKIIYNYIKKIKYLGVSLTKEVKDLYIENCKTLIQEIEEDTNEKMDWKN